MSVAFRREGDDEHLEPHFELPIPPGPNLVTARGLALTQARVDDLEARLHGVTGPDATGPGVSDEATRKALLRDLRYWRQRQATAQLMPEPAGARVEFGCTVGFTLGGQPRQITIVGNDEAEAAAGRIAFSAPLARAMIGAEPQDLLPFGGKEDAIEILSVTPRADLGQAG